MGHVPRVARPHAETLLLRPREHLQRGAERFEEKVTAREFNPRDPLVAEKLRERFGEAVPLDEPVVSPGQLFDSERLTLVPEE